MHTKKQNGFSLIELLIVVVVIGVIAAIAVPALQKARAAAENGSTIATMRTINSTQTGFFSQNNRFGRLTELQNIMNNGLGTTAGDRIVRGQFTYEMTPLVPTDASLRNTYTVTATRGNTAQITQVYKYEMTQNGVIVQLLPATSIPIGN